ncbi:hypothetical protein VB776_06730 [Arcicella sp. DC2W]|uniref:SMODS-associating 2TM beta-strand rich effector domain-containing protein n=1 Tax=Arcicella gelida TaxID=2984195 RepID=A0ABU5S2C3_9BACT|nr:hypothetical protein [Arcicella sp. DC2W]MEA5402601.1 hypothetical protein [Arcicella sp. DC2W]
MSEQKKEKLETLQIVKTPVLATQALILMLAIILTPSLWFSMRLIFNPPKASDIVLAISVGTFASVMYLWILDVTSILPFRSQWISKAVWTVAISTILSTSAAIYRGYFVEDRYPYQGVWEVTYQDNSIQITLPTVISYSESSSTYQGYTGVQKIRTGIRYFNGGDCPQYFSIEIVDFNPDKNYIIFRRHIEDNSEEIRRDLIVEREGKLLESKTPKENVDIINKGIKNLAEPDKIRLMRRN